MLLKDFFGIPYALIESELGVDEGPYLKYMRYPCVLDERCRDSSIYLDNIY